MNCAYPLCLQAPVLKPVIMIPTIREDGNGQMVGTRRPTYLIGDGLCQCHAREYNFLDWIGRKDWEKMQREADYRGFKLDDTIIRIEFKPLDWTLDSRYLEVER